MCVANATQGHTQDEKPEEVQKNKKTLSLKFKNQSRAIPVNAQWKLSEELKRVFRLKFIDNADCEDIIEMVISETRLDLKEFRKVISDFSTYDEIIFKTRPFNVKTVATELSHWILKKDEILVEIEKQKELERENEIKKQALHNEMKKIEEAKRIEEERKRLELVKAQKEKEDEEFQKLPEKFKEWFNKSNIYTKKELKKQLRTYGLDKFIRNIIPSIQSYKSEHKNINEDESLYI